jgi:hypothetical protein
MIPMMLFMILKIRPKPDRYLENFHLPFFLVLRPNVGHGLLIYKVSRSHTMTHHIGRTSLDERSARRRNLYLSTHNTHKRQTSMSPAGFEPTISTSELPQIHALDGTDTGTGFIYNYCS